MLSLYTFLSKNTLRLNADHISFQKSSFSCYQNLSPALALFSLELPDGLDISAPKVAIQVRAAVRARDLVPARLARETLQAQLDDPELGCGLEEEAGGDGDLGQMVSGFC